MKKTIIIFLILFSAIALIFYFLQEEEYNSKTIKYVNQGEVIEILNYEGEIVFEYSIEDFVDWAKTNWSEIFEEPPSFGEIREVDPENFYRFDNTAKLSPDFNFLAFSVNDYAVATNISFVGILNIEKERVELIRDKNMGGVQEIFWSPDGYYLAYILDTARAQGDYLTVDSIGKKKKVFTISGNDISDEEYVMPNFKNLNWSKDGQELSFIVDKDESGEEVEWRINVDGTNLIKKRN